MVGWWGGGVEHTWALIKPLPYSSMLRLYDSSVSSCGCDSSKDSKAMLRYLPHHWLRESVSVVLVVVKVEVAVAMGMG